MFLRTLAGINILVDYIMFNPFTSREELIENYEFLKKENLLGYFPDLLINKMDPYSTDYYRIMVHF